MSQYQRLLLILNPAQRHSPALHHAAALAAASGAHLHVIALIPSLDILSLLEERPREEARQNYLQDHRHWLEDEADKMRRRGLRVTTEVEWAQKMGKQILQHVTQIQPDLLIKQVQHEPMLKRAFSPRWTGNCCATARCRCTWWGPPVMRCRAPWSRRWTLPVRLPRTAG